MVWNNASSRGFIISAFFAVDRMGRFLYFIPQIGSITFGAIFFVSCFIKCTILLFVWWCLC